VEIQFFLFFVYRKAFKFNFFAFFIAKYHSIYKQFWTGFFCAQNAEQEWKFPFSLAAVKTLVVAVELGLI
jgi:hypothetical protein